MSESEILSNAFWRTVPFSYVPSFQLCTLIQVCTLTQVCTLIQVCTLSYVPSLIAIQLCTLLQPMYSPFKKKTCFKKYKWMKIIARTKIQFEWESLVAIACLFRILRFSLHRWNYYGSAAYAQGWHSVPAHTNWASYPLSISPNIHVDHCELYIPKGGLLATMFDCQ